MRGPGSVASFTSNQVPPERTSLAVGTEDLSENQQAILDVIRRTPGVTIQGVSDEIGLSHSTCSYHLNALQRVGLIAQERRGRVLLHYPSGRHRDPVTRLKCIYADSRKRMILDAIGEGQHLRRTINGLANLLGFPYGFVKRTLRELENEGLVNLSRRHYQYSLEVVKDIDSLLEKLDD